MSLTNHTISNIQIIINFFQEEISLIWIIFGTVGNLISIIILSMPKMRKHSTFTYLTVLAMCDTLVLYFGLLRDFLVSKYKLDVNGDLFCKFHVFSFYFVSVRKCLVLKFHFNLVFRIGTSHG